MSVASGTAISGYPAARTFAPAVRAWSSTKMSPPSFTAMRAGSVTPGGMGKGDGPARAVISTRLGGDPSSTTTAEPRTARSTGFPGTGMLLSNVRLHRSYTSTRPAPVSATNNRSLASTASPRGSLRAGCGGPPAANSPNSSAAGDSNRSSGSAGGSAAHRMRSTRPSARMLRYRRHSGSNASPAAGPGSGPTVPAMVLSVQASCNTPSTRAVPECAHRSQASSVPIRRKARGVRTRISTPPG